MTHPSEHTDTPPLNRIGLPDGMLEYSVRTAIRDLSKLYGRQQAKTIVTEILNDEVEQTS